MTLAHPAFIRKRAGPIWPATSAVSEVGCERVPRQGKHPCPQGSWASRLGVPGGPSPCWRVPHSSHPALPCSSFGPAVTWGLIPKREAPRASLASHGFPLMLQPGLVLPAPSWAGFSRSRKLPFPHPQCFPAVPTTKPMGPALTVTDQGLLFGISDLYRLEDLSEGCEQDGESMVAVSLSTSQATGVPHPHKRCVILEGKKPSLQHGAQHSAGRAAEGVQAATKTPPSAINRLTLSTNRGAA